MQLLRITTVPAQMEFSSQPARLQYRLKPLGYTMTKTGGSFEVHTAPTEMRLNSDAFRSDMNLGPISDSVAKWAQQGKQAGTEAIGRHVDLGNQMINIHKGATIPDLLLSRMMQDRGTSLVMMPLRPIDMSWTAPRMDMEYTPVKQNFDWQIAKNIMEFVPGKFDIQVKRYPEVKIEYLGEPNYVPPRQDAG